MPKQKKTKHLSDKTTPRLSRRDALRCRVTGALLSQAPWIWIPNKAYAQCDARGSIKHLIYVGLNGGFRFTAAFNGDVAAEFNPFGLARNIPSGVQWGPGRALEGAPWVQGDESGLLSEWNMRSVVELSSSMTLLPCVDHEPNSRSADGNHTTGLERYYTAYPGGGTSFFTMINYGLRESVATGNNSSSERLPTFVMGAGGMGLGAGPMAAYRPPVLEGTSFAQFQTSSLDSLPSWAKNIAEKQDLRMRDRQQVSLQPSVDAYIQSRKANERFARTFQDPALDIDAMGGEPIDGITQEELATIFGNNRTGRLCRLALRLFHFGCPAVHFGQGSWDMHSGEESRFVDSMQDVNRMLSGLHLALHRMSHPDGGTYWDHTLVVLGSEFGRTTRGSRFNSARGSDHAGDLATRWLSMPMMGGVIEALGHGGASLGRTRSRDLQAEGHVYSYRSVLKTLMDMLCADHSEFFPHDAPITEFG